MVDNRFKSRKFIITLLAMLIIIICVVGMIILSVFDKDISSFVAVCSILGACPTAYIAGNTIQKNIEKEEKESPLV